MERNPKVRIIPAKEEYTRFERVGIYARVSTAGRAQLRSLAAQISGLTRYVSKQDGWLLTDIYMDVDSAKTGSDRREFTRLLTDCKNHELDYNEERVPLWKRQHRSAESGTSVAGIRREDLFHGGRT